jgi:hypothetical protein
MALSPLSPFNQRCLIWRTSDTQRKQSHDILAPFCLIISGGCYTERTPTIFFEWGSTIRI